MIGVFDFGSGGLTVLRAFERALPGEKFVYYADHARAPYGNSDPDVIRGLTSDAVEYLFDRGCSLVVLACNTAVATSLKKLQQAGTSRRRPGRRVIGVIAPVVEEIAMISSSNSEGAERADSRGEARSVAVFATPHTVQSNIFVRELRRINPAILVHQHGCPGLAVLIEQCPVEDILRAEIKKRVEILFNSVDDIPKVCVLGCTHYAIVQHIWRSEIPAHVEILSQPGICAHSLVKYLRDNPQFSRLGAHRTDFITTGDVATVSERASLFYGAPVTFVNPGDG